MAIWVEKNLAGPLFSHPDKWKLQPWIHIPILLIRGGGKTGPVSQFILPPGQLAPRGASQPQLACPPGGKLSQDILPPILVIFTPGGQAVQAGLSCPPPHAEKFFLCDLYYYLQHFNNYMQFLSYKYVNLRCLLQTFSWVTYWQGVGGKLSCAVYLAPRPEFQREWIICKFYYTIYYRNI